MPMRTLLAATSMVLALSAGTALAEGAPQQTGQQQMGQQQGATQGKPKLAKGTLHEVTDSAMRVDNLNLTADQLDDMAIYGADGEKIGDVGTVLADNAGKIKAVSVDVGGFLGIGAREVVIPVDKLQRGQEEDRLTTAMTRDQIERLEEWRRDGAAGRDMDGRGDARNPGAGSGMDGHMTRPDTTRDAQ
jgi:sporulation protein YlmC with PRC-barrel domain